MSPAPRPPKETRVRNMLFLATVFGAIIIGFWLVR